MDYNGHVNMRKKHNKYEEYEKGILKSLANKLKNGGLNFYGGTEGLEGYVDCDSDDADSELKTNEKYTQLTNKIDNVLK